ncbi:MAG: undecaprenyldiphospho-muramoylpentapeptide beta-N-acetylglucosaminyltransferase, partial [Bacteroidota bacterium]
MKRRSSGVAGKETYRILISGGGSGGHIFPAIAIADALKEKRPDAEFLFVGAKGKIEMEKVPKAGYQIKGLWISGFHRGEILRNLLFPIKLIVSLLKAYGIIRRFRPHVVVGVGGFASGPTLEVASRLGIPTVIQEQNSFPGKTNRLLASKVNKICVAYDGLERFFPKQKIVKTGNPVRKDLTAAGDRAEALQHFGMEKDKPVVVLFGGSLGARSLNRAMRDNAELLRRHQDVQILWQAGKLYIEEFGQCETARLPHVKISAFIDRMDLAYAMADVLICRAGALTIAELALVGKPAILIPSPNVAEDHQTFNAKALTERAAALLVKDQDAAKEMIPAALQLLNDAKQRAAISQNIREMQQKNADERIAEEIL